MKKYILIFIVLITSLCSVQGQSIDQNYVKTTVYKKGFQEGVIGMAENDEKMETVQYFDGLGRPSQSVAIRQGGNKLENNIIDWKNTWALGSGSAPFFTQYGSTTENNRIMDTDPFGKESLIWRCGSDAASGSDGGWNTNYFDIDNSVGYRYTVWVKATGAKDGRLLHGTRNVKNLSNGADNTNPYFKVEYISNLNLNTWYLVVGIIHPHDYPGTTNSGVSGIYNTNGIKVKSGTDFKWSSTTETSLFRTMYYQADDINAELNFYNPLVQKLDGNEASIAEIIAGTNMADIITPIEYDVYGRQVKDYLPYSEATNDGLYRTDALTGVSNYYNTTKYENTLNPYSEKLFDKTPLNRVLEQTAPGTDWILGTVFDTNGHSDGNTIKFSNSTNIGTTDVRLYKVTLSTDYTPTLGVETVNNGYYGIGELYKTVTKDENWKSTQTNLNDLTTEEFKDKQGKVVLKRTYNGNVAHDTYYVYDDYGNLTYVLPPKLDATTANISAINGQLNDLGYQYKYDKRNRLIEKRIPGKGWEYIIYNLTDQPVLTQDENGRAKSPDEWLFTKYDAFGRVAYTGRKGINISRDTYQTSYADDSIIYNQFEDKQNNSQNLGGVNVYYSNNAIPTGVDEIYTINYYDNYTFDLPAGLLSTITTSYGVTSTAEVKGLPTGSKVKVLGTSSWITTVTYYDDQKRPIYVYTKNDYLGTTDILESKLIDFTDDIRGLVHQTKTTHKKSGETDIITIDMFTYDHTGRMLTQIQKINSQADEKIVQNNYDDLGQLIGKDVGGKTTKTALQNIEYKYNIRGWLKQINDVTNIGSDLFAFQLNYNDIADVNKKLYNGNISQSLWRTANTDSSLKDYKYTYDALNRITSGIDNTSNYNLTSVAYDKNGNITNLVRKGHVVNNPVLGNTSDFGTMDNLTYSYDSGNKLMKVADAASIDQFGFRDDAVNGAADTADDYSYDANGNLLTDANKGITSISYNYLNLPTLININDGGSNIGSISYIYDATGVKQKKIVSTGTTTEYAGNYVYEAGILKFFNHAEGYIEPSGSSYKYVYQYKDHLGNVRLSYSDANNNGTIEVTSDPLTTEIVEESNYYPFGLKHRGYNNAVTSTNPAQDYKYNGVELEESLGLNLYEMEFRQYDPAIGRFNSIDPITHYSQSTYTAFDNNPVYWSDPSGADSWTYVYGSNGVYRNNQTGEETKNWQRAINETKSETSNDDWIPIVDTESGKVTYKKEKDDDLFSFTGQYGGGTLADENLKITKNGDITSNTLYKLNVDNSTKKQRIFQTLAGITLYKQFNPDDIFNNNRSRKTMLTSFGVAVNQSADVTIDGVNFTISMKFVLNGSKKDILSFSNAIYTESTNQFNAKFSYLPSLSLPAIDIRFNSVNAYKALNKFTGGNIYWNGTSKEQTTNNPFRD